MYKHTDTCDRTTWKQCESPRNEELWQGIRSNCTPHLLFIMKIIIIIIIIIFKAVPCCSVLQYTLKNVGLF